jgi:hypothetical protein
MTGQLSMWTEETAFDRFHADNPRVYTTLVRLAREWVAKTGRHKVGISALYEVARWEIALATTDADFKIDNSHRAFYARLIMTQESDLAGLFDLRASKADEWIQGVA